MNYLVFGYEQIPPNSWAYLSSLLMIALFFKFNRFWALRNLDLILVILLAVGLLLVYEGKSLARKTDNSLRPSTTDVVTDAINHDAVPNNAPSLPIAIQPGEADAKTPPIQPETNGRTAEQALPDNTDNHAGSANATSAEPPTFEPVPDSRLNQGQKIERAGYIWLFGIGILLVLRTLFDPLLIRRPLLEPNLSTGGLVFLGLSMLSISIANIVITTPDAKALSGAEGGVKIVLRQAAQETDQRDLREHGPGYALFHALVVSTVQTELTVVAKVLAIVGEIALVLGLVFIGHYHFGNFRNGVGIAVLYMMLPYTWIYAGHVMHLLPAALLVWAVALYRYPIWSGVFVGLATGVSYYPFFLIALWMSFYWERGVWRFLIGLILALLIGIVGLIFTSVDVSAFFQQLQQMFGFWLPRVDGLSGIWALGWDPWFRLPIMVAFVVLCVSFVFWPTRKSVVALLAYSAAIMVSVQFWHGYDGGTHIAWYLPLCLLVFFRPNLSERYATTEVPSSRYRRRFRMDNREDVINTA
ncbi:MAG: hypothetical protein KF851_10415 [Pirellulaceae bacterium]|nr:hypothetical protein [Pirellulaceae bacterium]